MASDERVATDEDVIVRARRERDRSMIEHGRRIGGLPGAMVAGALIALRDIYEPPRDELVATAESPTEPTDVDTHGIHLSAALLEGDVDVSAPPLPPRAVPSTAARRRSRRRR